ncbi:hypothetical protein B0H17DRAFT_1030813 [Mycena rosella]|uniref:Uncharacterized protein n=1 Tax=Mycena rosella TaxID=1033263 RepID=A0AAD7GZW9_MYCRO|nr:hypothetical protein B0H17DRAFT_1030813 [Mycena rosella]
MSLQESPQLLGLPVELLLIMLDDLFEIHCSPPPKNPYLPASDSANCHRSTSFRFICYLRSLSTVSRRLRQLCLPLIFRTTRCTDLTRLQQLSAECTRNPNFARLIRHLDLGEVDARDVLLDLLPRLISLTWLELEASQLDARLLETMNSHASLDTVAVRDVHLNALAALQLPFPKIIVRKTHLNRELKHESEALRAVVTRGAKFEHLILHDRRDFGNGGASLLLPGLEQVDVEMCCPIISIETWLPNFAQRHTSLNTIKFFDEYGMFWRENPNIPFAPQFIDALRRETPPLDAELRSFSLARVASWTSLNDWEPTQLGLLLRSQSGISALSAASVLAPRLSSLDLVLHGTYATTPIHIDDFAEPFRYVTALRTLHLTNAYGHLHVGGRAPWLAPQRAAKPALGTSECVTAHHAMMWYMARVAQQAPSLDLIHVTDSGYDGKGRYRHPWTLRASYRVRNNAVRDLEVVGGTPALVMDPRYLPKS